jgi:5-methylcytosine-specific restriction endonuclease McrA
MATKKISELSPEEQEKRRVYNRARAKRLRLANPEKARAREQAQRLKHRAKRILESRAYRAANLERLREADRLYHQNNLEKRRQKDRDSYQRHAAKRRAKSQRWRKENPEKRRAGSRRWLENNREKDRASTRLRRARRKAVAINDFTEEQWRALCKTVGYRCCYCGKKFPFDKLEPDHLTPYAKQGNNTLQNILPACEFCNSSKKDRDVLRPVQPFLLLDDSAAD